MAEDDAPVGHAEDFCSLDVFFFAEGEDLSADEASGADPHRESDGDKDLVEAFADAQGDGEDEQDGGDGPEEIDEVHHDLVHPTAEVSGDGAEGDTNANRKEDSDEAHCKADAGADDDAGEDITAIAVGAEVEGNVLQWNGIEVRCVLARMVIDV